LLVALLSGSLLIRVRITLLIARLLVASVGVGVTLLGVALRGRLAIRRLLTIWRLLTVRRTG
jgi:hypothetical protein